MKRTLFSFAFFSFLLIQIVPLNAQNWSIAKRFAAATGGTLTNTALALAPDGSSYMVGNFRGTVHFDTLSASSPPGAAHDYGFLLKLDSALQPTWVRAFPERTYHVTVDQQSNAFVIGSIQTNTDDSLAFVAKYDPDGNLLASFHSSGTAMTWARVGCTDAAGNCYIGGERKSAGVSIFPPFTLPTVSSRQCFLVKLSPDLSQVMWATYTGSSPNIDNIYDIKLDNNGFVYTSGNYAQNNIFGVYSGSFYTEKHLTSTGASVWKKIFDSGSGTSTKQLMAFDSSGQSVFVSASFKNTTNFEPGLSLTAAANGDYHIYLAKMDAANGNVQWAKKVANTGDSYPLRMVRQGSDLYLTGYFLSPVLFGDTLLNQQGVDAFLLKMASSDGVVQSAEKFSGAEAESGYGLDARNEILEVSGNTNSINFTLGNFNLPGTSSSIYVAKKGGGLQLPPLASFSADTTSGCAPFTVQFNSTSTGNPATFNWQFPGGAPATSTDPNPSVSYQTPGTYPVSLSVGNTAGTNTATQAGFIVVNAAPAAQFTFNQNGLIATFNNQSSNADFLWDFGDGNTSTELNPVHTYADCGAYTVVLTSTNMCGTASSTASIFTSVTPTAMFTSTVEGFQVSFLNTSTGGTSFFWNFGDGNTSTLQIPPPHVYADAGTYVVTLVVTNNCGATIFQQMVTTLNTPTNTPSFLTGFRLFPNPNQGVFSIEMETIELVEIEYSILTSLGQIIHTETFTPLSESVTHAFDLGNVPPGTYWLRIRQGEACSLQKIVVLR